MNNSDLFDGSVVNPYNSWADGKVFNETVRIQTSMTDNPRFPTPSPTMVAFGDAVSAYGLALAKAGSKDKSAIAAKNARRAELIALCVQLGFSVSNTANGDVEALVSTSLPLRKKRQSVVLSPPSNLRIVNGINPGELDLKVDGMKGAATFGFEYTQDPPTEESVWVRTICSTSRCTIKNLESGKKFWFRTFVIGSKEQMVMGETLLSPYVQ